jgi:hypothetical protein
LGTAMLLGILATLGVLALLAWLMILLVRRLRSRLRGSLRYGLANVSRRAGTSVAQVSALGLGLMALLVLTFVRTLWKSASARDSISGAHIFARNAFVTALAVSGTVWCPFLNPSSAFTAPPSRPMKLMPATISAESAPAIVCSYQPSSVRVNSAKKIAASTHVTTDTSRPRFASVISSANVISPSPIP